MSEKKNFVSPIGRLVQGHPMEVQTKDMQGRPMVDRAGQPKQQIFFALAFAKSDPEWLTLYTLIKSVAKENFPNLFDAAGNCTAPAFSWKIVDGDSTAPNQAGNVPAQTDGFPGHYVVSFKTSFEIGCYREKGTQPIIDKNAIYRGCYLRVAGSVDGNGDTLKPGVFINPSVVNYEADGERIVTGPDAAAIFGGKTEATPPPTAAPVTPPPTAAPVTPAPAVTPAPDYLNPLTGATPPPPPPPPPTEPKYNHGGTLYTKAQLFAAGWNEEQINRLPQS